MVDQNGPIRRSICNFERSKTSHLQIGLGTSFRFVLVFSSLRLCGRFDIFKMPLDR